MPPFPGARSAPTARGVRGAILVWSVAARDRFGRCGALPRRPRRARPRAGAAEAWAGRLDRHACRPCRAYLRDRFRGACRFNAFARHWFATHRLFSSCERAHRSAVPCRARWLARCIAFSTNGSGLMRRRLIAWTIMTSALVAVTVWSMLGPAFRRSPCRDRCRHRRRDRPGDWHPERRAASPPPCSLLSFSFLESVPAEKQPRGFDIDRSGSLP